MPGWAKTMHEVLIHLEGGGNMSPIKKMKQGSMHNCTTLALFLATIYIIKCVPPKACTTIIRSFKYCKFANLSDHYTNPILYLNPPIECASISLNTLTECASNSTCNVKLQL